MRDKSVKICLVASAGGHLTQLLKLDKSWKDYKTFCITTAKVMRQKMHQYGIVYVVGECNHKQPLRVIKVFLQCFRIVFKERPNAIISTGAAAGCMVCFMGKLWGARVIWIDSITNIEKLSLSGRMVRYIADLFLVQWPELTRIYKNTEYAGVVT